MEKSLRTQFMDYMIVNRYADPTKPLRPCETNEAGQEVYKIIEKLSW